MWDFTIVNNTNDISQNFSGITLDCHEIAYYFVDFQFCSQYFQKMTAKFWFLSNWFKISKFRTWRWRKLKKSKSQLPNHRLKIEGLTTATAAVADTKMAIKVVNIIYDPLFNLQMLFNVLRQTIYEINIPIIFFLQPNLT